MCREEHTPVKNVEDGFALMHCIQRCSSFLPLITLWLMLTGELQERLVSVFHSHWVASLLATPDIDIKGAGAFTVQHWCQHANGCGTCGSVSGSTVLLAVKAVQYGCWDFYMAPQLKIFSPWPGGQKLTSDEALTQTVQKKMNDNVSEFFK